MKPIFLAVSVTGTIVGFTTLIFLPSDTHVGPGRLASTGIVFLTVVIGSLLEFAKQKEFCLTWFIISLLIVSGINPDI